MSRPRRAALIVVAISMMALACSSASLRARPAGPTPRTIDRSELLSHPLAFFDPRTFALAVARASRRHEPRATGIRGVIVPHHWLAADLILEGLRGLAANLEVRRVVLIGPNHSGAGGASFSTSRWSWRAPGGLVRSDDAGLRAIQAGRLARAVPNVLSNEHSIAGLVPALGHLFPGVTVVPIAVRARTDPDALRRMAESLATLLIDPHTVVVASVDFSHYRSALEAKRRNRESIRAIADFDVGRVLAFGNDHMDSPTTIGLVLETMLLAGAERFSLWEDRTSAEFGGPSQAPAVTSYLVGVFH